MRHNICSRPSSLCPSWMNRKLWQTLHEAYETLGCTPVLSWVSLMDANIAGRPNLRRVCCPSQTWQVVQRGNMILKRSALPLPLYVLTSALSEPRNSVISMFEVEWIMFLASIGENASRFGDKAYGVEVWYECHRIYHNSKGSWHISRARAYYAHLPPKQTNG